MAFISDSILDGGLTLIDGTTVRIDICYGGSEPTTYAAATSTASCGNKTGLTVSAITDAAGGRKVTIPSFTDGSVTGSQTAAYWALTDGTSTLFATGALSSSQAVTNGNNFSLTAIDITFNDAV